MCTIKKIVLCTDIFLKDQIRIMHSQSHNVSLKIKFVLHVSLKDQIRIMLSESELVTSPMTSRRSRRSHVTPVPGEGAP